MPKMQQQAGQQTTRLPLIGSYSNRDYSGNKDQRFINAFPETKKTEALENQKIYLYKRPGLEYIDSFTTNPGRGFIFFNTKFYAAVGDKLHEYGNITPKITFSTSTGKVGMVIGNSTTLGDYLFVCDGIGGWVIKTDGTVLTIDNSSLRRINVTSGGTAYLGTPVVTITGSGTGATATATLSGGVVSDITLTDGGTGYTSEPTISFSIVVTPDQSLDTLAYTNHGYANDTRVKFSTTGTIPTGLSTSTAYYVVSSTADTFKVSTTSGGAAVNFTTNGSGILTAISGAPTTQATATAQLTSFPTPHIPTPTFIDGYILIPNNSDVYNCVVDEPTDWDPSNYLTAEMFPDEVVSLARQNNQVVVFGKSSIEFFYDAANISGSPLTRNDSTSIQLGCASPYAIFQGEKFCIFVAQSDSGGRSVWLIDGFQPKKISDEYIERILDADSTINTASGYGLRTMGHLFYVVNLKGVDRTLVYDVEEKMWHEWSQRYANAHIGMQYDNIADEGNGAVYLLHNANGFFFKLNPAIYEDQGEDIFVDITTTKYDFDTYSRKFMHSVKVVGDQYANNSISLRWTDDDYQTWSNWKTITLHDSFPAFHRLGQFRRRAFNIKHIDNAPLRLEALECTFTTGDY